MAPSYPRVCVIGAGSSGITVIKALKDRDIPFDCFEKGDEIGGNWLYKNSNGVSSAYESLHINTSRDRMSYADYPMPPDYPDFPGHKPIEDYFKNYVEHFGLRSHITFKTSVKHAELLEDKTWRVDLDNGETRFYDALVVANGHHWDPRWPEPGDFPGEFDGTVMHSHYYHSPSEPAELHGKRIVVIGMGNSAMDIACELSRAGIAEKLYLSARRGAWIIPNYLFGRPLDKLGGTHPLMPIAVQRFIFKMLMSVSVGSPVKYGLPEPDHKLLEAHPTVSQDLPVRVGRGDITPKPIVTELLGDSVRFADGSVEKVDAIIYCTGYKVTFPFFDEKFISTRNNDLPLWKRMIKPGIPNLIFIGLLQPLGAIMPIAEAQGKFLGDYLLGKYLLPSKHEMEAEIAAERKKMFKRYVKSDRHTMQVDYDLYLYRLRKDKQAGVKRAEQAGNPLPILPKSHRHDPLAESSPEAADASADTALREVPA